MKRAYRLLTMVLVLAVCVSILTACTDEKKNEASSNTDTSVETGNTENTVDAEEEEFEDIIGVITSVGDAYSDGESSLSDEEDLTGAYFYVDAYASAGEVEDYTNVDVSTLQALDNVSYIAIEWDTEYYSAYNGELVPALFNDFGIGDWIAVTENEYGVQQVIMMKDVEEEIIEDDLMEDFEEVWEDETLEE